MLVIYLSNEQTSYLFLIESESLSKGANTLALFNFVVFPLITFQLFFASVLPNYDICELPTNECNY